MKRALRYHHATKQNYNTALHHDYYYYYYQMYTNLFLHKACPECHLSLQHQPSVLPQAEQFEASMISPLLSTHVPSPDQRHWRPASHLPLSESDIHSRVLEGGALAENIRSSFT